MCRVPIAAAVSTFTPPAWLDAAVLREFLAQHLARFEIPRHIFIASQPLPRTPSGKILKREIRQAALQVIDSQDTRGAKG